MGDRSEIEWTDATWNPVTGCDQISPGCDNCYALRLAGRLKAMRSVRYQNDGDPRTSGPGFGLTLHEDDAMLTKPLRWKAPRRIFVNSMSDLFHPDVPDAFIHKVFEVMENASWHIFQVLTKRSRRLEMMAPSLVWSPNIWIGVSIESNAYVFRARHLASVEGPSVRFISAEPLLGPLDLMPLDNIDWLITGGESGPCFRPVEEAWILGLRDRCVDAGIPFFFKQWGGRTPKAGGCELLGETHHHMPSGLMPTAPGLRS